MSLPIVVVTAVLAGPQPAAADVTYEAPVKVGTFDAAMIPEASGLAAGYRNPGVLYLLNDHPDTRHVWAVRTDGETIGRIAFTADPALDAESLAIAPCTAGSASRCLYVADIGDNSSQRSSIRIWRFPEPDLSAGVPAGVVAADLITLRYPDGAHNAEALIVDDAGVPHILTKVERDADGTPSGPPELYAAPGFASGQLTAHGTVPLPRPGLVTGGEARAGRVLVRTYTDLFEYVAPVAGAPLRELASWPATAVPVAPEPQGEAVTYAADGCGYYTVSERVGDIWFSRCSDPNALPPPPPPPPPGSSGTPSAAVGRGAASGEPGHRRSTG